MRIRLGVVLPIWETVTCSRCKSIFSYEKSGYTVRCPVCNSVRLYKGVGTPLAETRIIKTAPWQWTDESLHVLNNSGFMMRRRICQKCGALVEVVGRPRPVGGTPLFEGVPQSCPICGEFVIDGMSIELIQENWKEISLAEYKFPWTPVLIIGGCIAGVVIISKLLRR